MDMATTVGVVSLATNRYVEYWMKLARTSDECLFPAHEVVMHVFTDRADVVREFSSDLKRIKVNAVSIDPLAWPAAPLQKFQVISDHREYLQHDLVMHLDADMLVVAPAGDELEPSAWQGGMALVRHPGYRRPPKPKLRSLYARNPQIAVRDAYRKILVGGIGTWESERASLAYVPRSLRSNYVCGATWMGLRESFLETAKLLAERTTVDTDHDRIAVWHDESHLNWFAAHRPCTILDADYCFAEGLPNLQDIRPKIVAVEKRDDRTR